MRRLFTMIILILWVTSMLIFSQDSNEETLKKMKPALLVIDIQNAFIPHMDQNGKDSAMARINYYIDLFRQKEFPVIRIYHTDPKYGVVPDTEPFEFPATVHINKVDTRVIKTYADAFNKTDLDKILKEKGRNTVLLCGLSATGCVQATLIGAQNHDYFSLLIKDAMLSPKLAYTKSIEEIFGAISDESVKYILDHAQR
ncbi:MAG: hypothetical protein C0412_05160 [Flavobacterium sp.]|nr:hypothetical protein [Flavobacterium sp.]